MPVQTSPHLSVPPVDGAGEGGAPLAGHHVHELLEGDGGGGAGVSEHEMENRELKVYSLPVGQVNETVNLLGRNLILELLLINDDQELGPRNLSKPLRVELVEYRPPFVFEKKLLSSEVLLVRAKFGSLISDPWEWETDNRRNNLTSAFIAKNEKDKKFHYHSV